MAQHIPLAWRQLTFHRTKLVAALAGVTVAVTLMWLQLGLRQSIYSRATVVHRGIRADLVVLSPLSETLGQPKPLSTRVLYRARGNPDVAAVGDLFVGPSEWRNPATGEKKQIQVYGLEPEEGWVDLPGVAEHAAELRSEDKFLYDRLSREVFGPVVPALERGDRFEAELNRRQMRAVGLTSMAATFSQQGNAVMTRANFLRTHPGHPPEQVHVGFIRLRPGADVRAVQEQLKGHLAGEALVLTPAELTELELRFWKTNSPVGFIFIVGTVAGFVIGFIVVYQILYADVTHHLPYYVTMKAMGFADGFLLRPVVRQGLILSVLGYVPGSLLAIAFYKVVEAGTSIPVTPTWERAALLFALTTAMCSLSGAVATRRSRTADPADVF